MHPIRTALAGRSATTFESLGTLLSSHRAVTRVSMAALSFTIIVALSQQAAPTIQAGPEPAPLVPESLLPQSVGVSVPSGDAVTIPFETSMDAASVEAALQVLPAQKVELSWNEDHTRLDLRPDTRWRTDEGYLVVVAESATAADGTALAGAKRYAFTTQPAPSVADFQVALAPGAEPDEKIDADVDQALAAEGVSTRDTPGSQPPTETATEVSATSAITISFDAPMDHTDVEAHFSIAPEVEGDLSWNGGDLVFSPTGRLDPGARYTISLVGAHDAAGNVLGGEGNFSFVVQEGAQLTKTAQKAGATDVEPATVELWFSQPMDVDATNAAFALKDTATGALVGGLLNWNEAGTQLIYTPDDPFAGGGTFEVSLAEGARDLDGNAVTTTWSFQTKAAPVVNRAPATTTRAAPVVPRAAPATSLAGYALNQVNAARAAYGFGPVVLDAAISAAAAAHAWDQAQNGYFSHYSLDGRTREDRLRAQGVSFGWSGENQCYHVGMSEQSTLDWCHAQFMAEPYPGHWNHIGNILNPNARRMGVGIANVAGKIVIVWDFAD